jgi:hypothetical protein
MWFLVWPNFQLGLKFLEPGNFWKRLSTLKEAFQMLKVMQTKYFFEKSKMTGNKLVQRIEFIETPKRKAESWNWKIFLGGINWNCFLLSVPSLKCQKYIWYQDKKFPFLLVFSHLRCLWMDIGSLPASPKQWLCQDTDMQLPWICQDHRLSRLFQSYSDVF